MNAEGPSPGSRAGGSSRTAPWQIALLLAALVPALVQPILPLLEDQLIHATALLRLEDPSLFASDPLWGRDELSLTLNLGALVFFAGRWLGDGLEAGSIVVLAVVRALLLLASFHLLLRLTGSSPVAFGFALLGSLRVATPAATLWGMSDATTLLPRVVFEPLVPLLVLAMLRLLGLDRAGAAESRPELRPRAVVPLFALLGLSSLIHQVSSLYLFLGFVLALGWRTRWRAGPPVWAAGAFLLGALPTVLLFVGVTLHGSSPAPVDPAALEEAIRFRYSWAFEWSSPALLALFLRRSPFLLLAAAAAVWRREDPRIRGLALLAVTVTAGTWAVYGLELAAHRLGLPLVFIELGRGLRFLPFLALAILAVAAAGLGEGRRAVVRRSLGGAAVALGLVFYGMMTTRLGRGPDRPTCQDPIYRTVRALPETSLLLGGGAESRYCGRRSLYATYKDGAHAFYNGPEAMVAWHARYRASERFFERPTGEALSKLPGPAPTHVLTESPLPDSPLWTPIAHSPRWHLYRLSPPHKATLHSAP